MVGVVDLDEFDGSLPMCCVKVISCVRMFWSLIFKIYIFCYVCWEIVLLSPEDLCELLVAESFVLNGRHGGSNSVFQEFVGKPNLC